MTEAENTNYVLESDIIETLKLHPIRAEKWLYLLCCEHFLIKTSTGIGKQQAYQLPFELKQLTQSKAWESIQFYFNNCWMDVANENLTDVLRHGAFKVDRSWPWPPKSKEQAIWLEDWMRKTAASTLNLILEEINFENVNNFLDVGGGDGTMACALVSAYPQLKATVYNLPGSAELARENIKARNLSHQVSVMEGNFLEDNTFSSGFDLILFARVLLDWDETVNRKLLKMAYQALPENGYVVICETLKEDNSDLCLACEYRYIFFDDFSPHVFKSEAEYRMMIEDTGFSFLGNKRRPNNSLLFAQK